MRTEALLIVCALLLLAPAQAEEKPSPILTGLSATTISGYVDTSAIWNPGSPSSASMPTRRLVRFDDLSKALHQSGLQLQTSMGRYVFSRASHPVLALYKTGPLATRSQIHAARRFLKEGAL